MPPKTSEFAICCSRKIRIIQRSWSFWLIVRVMRRKFSRVFSSMSSPRCSLTPKTVKRMNSGARMAMISAMMPYAVPALPPRAFEPTVNIGIRTEASVEPTPAKNVAREVYWLRRSASRESAGIMPQ